MAAATSIPKRRSQRLALSPSPPADPVHQTTTHTPMSPEALNDDQPVFPPPIETPTNDFTPANIFSGDNLQINDLSSSSSIVVLGSSSTQSLLMDRYPVSFCASALYFIIQALNIDLQ